LNFDNTDVLNIYEMAQIENSINDRKETD